MKDEYPRPGRILDALHRHESKREKERLREAAPRRQRKAGKIPTEASEQARLCQWLDGQGIEYHSTPNEGAGGNRGRAARLKAMGVKAGFPDITIDTPPPVPLARVVHIELKRDGRQGERDGGRSRAQVAMHEILDGCGDVVLLTYGFEDTKRQLRRFGYGER